MRHAGHEQLGSNDEVGEGPLAQSLRVDHHRASVTVEEGEREW